LAQQLQHRLVPGVLYQPTLDVRSRAGQILQREVATRAPKQGLQMRWLAFEYSGAVSYDAIVLLQFGETGRAIQQQLRPQQLAALQQRGRGMCEW
jgi:hypothetical protein